MWISKNELRKLEDRIDDLERKNVICFSYTGFPFVPIKEVVSLILNELKLEVKYDCPRTYLRKYKDTNNASTK